MKQKKSGRNTKSHLIELHQSIITQDLTNPEFAAQLLEEVLQEGSMESFLLAVRLVAQAQYGLRKLSSKAKVGRESLYKSLSKKGNPQFSTLNTILNSMDLRFSVVAKRKKQAA